MTRDEIEELKAELYMDGKLPVPRGMTALDRLLTLDELLRRALPTLKGELEFIVNDTDLADARALVEEIESALGGRG